MFGFLNINKPPGPTSHDIVAAIRRRFGKGVKVGHAGTLDPFASGVLVLCIGQATRLADYVQTQKKEYRAVVTLGATSDTDDTEGKIKLTENVNRPSHEEVRKATADFVGKISQVPPAYSAVHIDGKRAYKLAREGQEFKISARDVDVHAIEILRYDFPELEILVRCGSGTYIRSLARDIGQAVGAGGYCSFLMRTAVGEFRIEQSSGLNDEDLAKKILPAIMAMDGMEKVQVNPQQAERLAMGQTVRGEFFEAEAEVEAEEPCQLAVIDQRGKLIAIGEIIPMGENKKNNENIQTLRSIKNFTKA